MPPITECALNPVQSLRFYISPDDMPGGGLDRLFRSLPTLLGPKDRFRSRRPCAAAAIRLDMPRWRSIGWSTLSGIELHTRNTVYTAEKTTAFLTTRPTETIKGSQLRLDPAMTL